MIAEGAEENTGWHRPMVFRDDLPVRTIRRIASFVNAALMEALIERNSTRKDLVEKLRKTVRERIERGDMAEQAETYVPALARASSPAETVPLATARPDRMSASSPAVTPPPPNPRADIPTSLPASIEPNATQPSIGTSNSQPRLAQRTISDPTRVAPRPPAPPQ